MHVAATRRITSLACSLALLSLGSPAALGQPGIEVSSAEVQKLERSWKALDEQLRVLDALIPPAPQGIPPREAVTAPIPGSLLEPNRAPSQPLQPNQAAAPAPLSLPSPQQLQEGVVEGLSLLEALAIGFKNNPELQAQRELVAASLDDLQAALGTYWPRISAVAGGSTGQLSSNNTASVGNGNLNLGPLFQPGGAFYVTTDGGAYLNQSSSVGAAGLQLDYALLDFARTPRVQAARAVLERERQVYGNQLRLLQLSISEAYYQLQQADQNVRIQDAAVRDDLLILQDSLDLKLAGLVPRVDVLRRRAIEASDQEALIQALADRAIARRRLALVLNLPATVTPSASDPIAVMPQWPLNLEVILCDKSWGAENKL